MLRTVPLVLTVLLLGCSSTTDPPVRLVATTQLLRYAPGDSVLVRFANFGVETLEYNGCFGHLERRGASSWVSVGPAFGSVPCLSIVIMLPAGAADSVRFGLTPGLPQGVYRYFLSVFTTQGGGDLSVTDRATNAFQVQ